MQTYTTFNGPYDDSDYGHGITVDSAGNVYAIGSIRVSPGAGFGEGINIWIAKYNSSLVLQASTTVNGPDNETDIGRDITIGENGNIYVIGDVNYYDSNIWIAKYNSSMVLQASTTINGPGSGSDLGYRIATDDSQNVYAIGSITNTSGYRDIWLGKYNSSLVLQTSSTFSSSGNWDDDGYGISIDTKAAEIYVSGRLSGPDSSLWIAKFSTSTVLKSYLTNSGYNGSDFYVSDSIGYAITSDNKGSVYVTGQILDDGVYKIGTENYLVYTNAVTSTVNEALDNSNLVWTTGGDATWFSENTIFYFGSDAHQSGTITHNQQTHIQTVASGPGTLSFYWKVSSEANFDFLRFYIDGVSQGVISGSTNWAQKTYSIVSGAHTLKWVYSKDGSESSGLDAGWLDKVEFISSGTLLSPTFTTVAISSLVLNWQPVAGTNYNAILSNNSSFSSNVSSGILAANTTTYGSLSGGTTYYFQVKLSTESEAAYSINRISTATLSAPAPSVPTGFSGTALGVSSISWSWNDVSGETGYRVIPSTSNTSLSGNLSANSTVWIETGLTINTSYSRKVVAFNEAGASTSTATSATTGILPVVTFLPYSCSQ